MSAKLTATFCGDRPPHIRQNLAAMCPIQDPLSGTRTEEAGRGQDRNERERERENTEPSLPCVTPNLRNQAALLLAHSNGQESQRSKREAITSPVSGSLLLSLCKKSMWDGVYIGGATFENTIRQPPNNWK